MTDQAAITTIVDSLVAIGTLALAALTVYQLRLFINERKANQARELAERIYTPLRMEVAIWTKPEEVFNGALSASKTWTELKEKAPYLTLKLPRDLRDTLDSAERLLSRIYFLSSQVRAMIQEETDRLGMALCAKRSVSFHGSPFIRVVGGHQMITQVYLGSVWCSKMSLKEWVENYVKDHYPVKDWEVEIFSGSDRIGALKEGEEMAEAMFALLKNQPFARELLEKIYEVQGLANKAICRIDEELSKPVAPWE
jgi:hypothetical protein